jgi:hypothetical protein
MLQLHADTDTDTDTARAAQPARPGSHFDRTREINTRSISLFDVSRLGGPSELRGPNARRFHPLWRVYLRPYVALALQIVNMALEEKQPSVHILIVDWGNAPRHR